MDTQYANYPYQTPVLPPKEPTEFPTGGPVRCPSSMQNLSTALAILRQDFGAAVGAHAVFFVVLFSVGFAMMVGLMLIFVGTIMPDPRAPLPTLFVPVNLALTVLLCGLGVVLMGGLFRVYILRMRGYAASAAEVFNFNGMAGQLALAGVVGGIAYSLPSLLSLLIMPASSSGELPPFPSTAQVVASIVLSLAFSIGTWAAASLLCLVPAIIVDQRKPMLEAMTLSLRAMAPRWYAAMGMVLLAYILSSLGILLCGIGWFVTGPIFYLMIAVFYYESFIRPTIPVESGGEGFST